MITESDQKRRKDSDDIQRMVNLWYSLFEENIGQDDCKYWNQLLDHTNHAEAEEGHWIVSDKLREDALEDAEG